MAMAMARVPGLAPVRGMAKERVPVWALEPELGTVRCRCTDRRRSTVDRCWWGHCWPLDWCLASTSSICSSCRCSSRSNRQRRLRSMTKPDSSCQIHQSTKVSGSVRVKEPVQALAQEPAQERQRLPWLSTAWVQQVDSSSYRPRRCGSRVPRIRGRCSWPRYRRYRSRLRAKRVCWPAPATRCRQPQRGRFQTHLPLGPNPTCCRLPLQSSSFPVRSPSSSSPMIKKLSCQSSDFVVVIAIWHAWFATRCAASRGWQ